jgi:formamidopyrimidine-DNA glycosylase
MPELPEVETTLRGIRPHLSGQIIESLNVREGRLRWPIPSGLSEKLQGHSIHGLARRGKYILISTGQGTLILHLGMSGSLRITETNIPPRKHDHYDLILGGGVCLRFHDPRRFGCLLWTEDDPEEHALIAPLGPEPLSDGFNSEHLHARSRGRTAAVKSLIMDSHVVVGVGNIYASESLFRAGIAPQRAAGNISLERYGRLVDAIREVLRASIEQGGTTLRDFVNESGNPGYFKQTLNVYDRASEPCRVCGTPIKTSRLGQRSTFWCPRCQR